MAARRLLIIMLVLLGVSSLLAIALPNPERNNETSQESATTGETGSTGATGETGGGEPIKENESESVSPGAGTGPVASETVRLQAPKPALIKAKPGTRMTLEVESRTASEVEIDGLGLTGFADRYAPAVFDLIFPLRPGRYEVRAPGGMPAAILIANPQGKDAS